jgi:hypothetical protein
MKKSVLTFAAQTHWNALRDQQIPPDAKKHKFVATYLGTLFMETT